MSEPLDLTTASCSLDAPPASPRDVVRAEPGPRVEKTSGRHVQSLDGLRAVAITGVLLVHAGAPGFNLGWMGVDLFFVLSGFLITNLLVGEYTRTGRISFAKFWARRFLRLMPAYWLYAGIMTLAMLVFHWGWTASHGGWTPEFFALSIWCYFENYAPLGGIWEHQDLTMILWSLSVEEQFYFLWPVICGLLFRTGWTPRFAWGLAAAILVRRGFASQGELIALLSTRGFAIVLGSAFALSLGQEAAPRAKRWLSDPAARGGVLAALALVFVASTAFVLAGSIDEEFVYRYIVPVVSLLFAVLTAMLWYGPRDWLARWLSIPALVYLGRISYGVYLYHNLARYWTWGLLEWTSAWSKYPKYALRLTVYLTLALLIASASYHLIEKPFLKLKDRLRA